MEEILQRIARVETLIETCKAEAQFDRDVIHERMDMFEKQIALMETRIHSLEMKAAMFVGAIAIAQTILQLVLHFAAK